MLLPWQRDTGTYRFTEQFTLYNYMVSSYRWFFIVIILPEGGEAVVKAGGV